MNTGKVKFYNTKKGFGFIIDDNSNEEIFFHATGLKDRGTSLTQDDEVSYELSDTKKGINAIQVEKA